MTPIAATLLGRRLAGGRRPFPAREVYRAILNECVSEGIRGSPASKRQSRECAGGDCCLAKTTQCTAGMRK
jgi:hypothetical protein